MSNARLSALADELDRRNTPPNNWASLLQWATTIELGQLKGDAEGAIEEIRQRCEQRFRLRLYPRELRCLGRRRNSACYCGENALEALSAAELETWKRSEAKKRLRELAGAHHVPARRWPQAKHKASPAPERSIEPAPAPITPPPPPEIVTETPTRTRGRVRFRPVARTPKWYDASELGAATRGIRDRIF